MDPIKKSSKYNKSIIKKLLLQKPEENVIEQLESTIDYIESPMYKKRLENMIGSDVDANMNYINPLAKSVNAKKGEDVAKIASRIIKKQLNNIYKTGFGFNNTDKSLLGQTVTKYGKNKNNPESITVSLRKDESDTSTPSHEFSHASLGGIKPYSDYFSLKNISNKVFNKNSGNPASDSFFNYTTSPEEIKANIDAVRYELKRLGIYDANKEEFNKNHFKKIIENIKSKDLDSAKDILKVLKDEKAESGFIWLMNNIAKNKGGSNNSNLV